MNDIRLFIDSPDIIFNKIIANIDHQEQELKTQLLQYERLKGIIKDKFSEEIHYNSYYLLDIIDCKIRQAQSLIDSLRIEQEELIIINSSYHLDFLLNGIKATIIIVINKLNDAISKLRG